MMVSSDTAATAVDSVADDYLGALLARYPSHGYLIDLPPKRHDGFEDNSLEALAAWHATEDQILARLNAIDPVAVRGTAQWITLGVLRESLQASVQTRVCRRELWGINQLQGWHLLYLQIAEAQPVENAEHRAQALTRWSRLPRFIDTEMQNLRMGLDQGYSAAKANVKRVLTQVDGYLALPTQKDPFYAIAAGTSDPKFEKAFKQLVERRIKPAVARYRAFLADEYFARARESLALTANPDGRDCYQALLRRHTTLNRTPEEVFALGQQTVAKYRAEVIARGRELYGTEAFAEIIERAKNDPANRFSGRDEVIAFACKRTAEAEAAMPGYFANMPRAKVVVEPFPPHLDGTGVSSRYEAPSGGRPGTYRIAVNDPSIQRQDDNEVTAFHETYPGHHLQIAIEQELEGVHVVGRAASNSAFGEGWARYAESLAEEIGLYQTASGPLIRRAWPARGMVVDPGVHVMGWDPERAIAFIMESGRLDRNAAGRLVDRIAAEPGQLTSYDSGALEIVELRRRAEEQLGDAFDLSLFHTKVLENGTVPLWMLRAHIDAWLSGPRRSKPHRKGEPD